MVLYADNDPATVPEEMLLCLQDAPEAGRFFQSLSGKDQQQYVKWIYGARTVAIREGRLARAIDRLTRNLRYGGQDRR